MAITTIHSPSPATVGEAAAIAGLEERRRYEQQQAMRQQQLDQAAQESAFRQQMALAQLNQQAFQFEVGLQARSEDAARARQMSLAAQAMQGDQSMQRLQAQALMQQQQQGFTGEQNALNRQAGMQESMLQQQAINERQGMTLQAQQDMQRQSHIQQQMMSDWARVQKVLPDLTPEEGQELISNFQNRYAGQGLTPPVDIPQPPENPLDPEVVGQKIMNGEEVYPITMTPDGSVEVIRGFPQEGWPGYQERKQQEMQQEHAYNMEIEDQKRAAAAAKDAIVAKNNFNTSYEAIRKNAMAQFTKFIPGAVPGDKGREEMDREAFQSYMQEQEIRLRGQYFPPPYKTPIPPELQAFPWVMDKREADLLPKGSRVIMLINGTWTIVESEGNENSGAQS